MILMYLSFNISSINGCKNLNLLYFLLQRKYRFRIKTQQHQRRTNHPRKHPTLLESNRFIQLNLESCARTRPRRERKHNRNRRNRDTSRADPQAIVQQFARHKPDLAIRPRSASIHAQKHNNRNRKLKHKIAIERECHFFFDFLRRGRQCIHVRRQRSVAVDDLEIPQLANQRFRQCRRQYQRRSRRILRHLQQLKRLHRRSHHRLQELKRPSRHQN